MEDFRLHAGAEKDTFLYTLILSQLNSNRRLAEGTVKLSVTGQQEGQSVTLPYDKLNGDSSDTVNFSFKYFQSLEGLLVIPDGFVPSEIKVQVRPNSKRLDRVERSYSWDESVVGAH